MWLSVNITYQLFPPNTSTGARYGDTGSLPEWPGGD